MKKICLFTLGALIVSTVFTAVSYAKPSATRRGKMVSHYQTRNTLTGFEVELTAGGSLRLQSNVQGNSAKESFRMTVTGLSATNEYQLVAIQDEDTNSVPIGEFTTDNNGNSTVVYSRKGNGNGKNNSLPQEIDSLIDLRAIGVVNANTQMVLAAWINDTTFYQYLVKKNLDAADTNGTAEGSISLKSNARNTKFTLLAAGLSATNQYHLLLNDSNVVETVNSDSAGRITIKSWPAMAPAILDLRSLALIDGSSNAVLTTTLPR